MPKPTLAKEDAILEAQLIETMLAGHHLYKPDLPYPESHSDMQGCARALMRMFTIQRRPLVSSLRMRCDLCKESGRLIARVDETHTSSETCPNCNGRGYVV